MYSTFLGPPYHLIPNDYFQPSERQWKQFTVPREVLSTLQNTCPSTPLLQLPTEILIAIFDRADDIDQLALALSCKHLIHASTLVSLKNSVFAGHMVNPYQLRTILVRLMSPTTNAWKLCTLCTLYRPTRKSYWEVKADLRKWEEVKAKEAELMTITINDWKYVEKESAGHSPDHSHRNQSYANHEGDCSPRFQDSVWYTPFHIPPYTPRAMMKTSPSGPQMDPSAIRRVTPG
ncbi:hypothetical protein O988_07672 [Pseudogymnoascus sp. VKM F-3808]|nr:hypothetical protein O988_07672 [Pseudogymnoascus sp. VKM F-3808]